MKAIKKSFAILMVALLPVIAFAQTSRFPNRRELVEFNDEDGDLKYEVYAMDDNGHSTYYLCVGHLGFGDNVVQVYLDPVTTLSVYLGDSLAEAVDAIIGLQELVKGDNGATVEKTGYLSLGIPDDKPETVTITTRKGLLGRSLDFSLDRGDYIRATSLSRSDVNEIAAGLKGYKRIHPKEQ